jgi:CRISPR-associated endonuclease/helicase Cas3
VTDLQIDDFDAFFRELYGPSAEPFAWQRDLVRLVAFDGWPSQIDLPTASGKTAIIDMAVFTMALDAGKASRRAPLRVFFVVDRRVVVDEAHRRAKRMAVRLAAASTGVLGFVAGRLHKLGGEGAPPLVAAVLRGGIYREDGWARSPIQPLVVVSTVDQVGSRLLGRGYGVSDAMKSVHQGIVAHDSLIVLDEAHLSGPFQETVLALRDYAEQGSVRLPRPFQVVVMSATPRSPGLRPFRLGHESTGDLQDRRPGRLSQRLEGHKEAELRRVELGTPPPKTAPSTKHREWAAGRAQRDARFCKDVATAAHELLAASPCVGVVVNRVGTARLVFELLRHAESHDGVLLTGRSRPLDRESVVRQIWARARAGRTRRADERPLIVVATQCIEAGADLDFDALLTECASIDALKQRFGRLDRLGQLGLARAIIMVRSDNLDDDPIYGTAIGKTFKWLWKKARKPRGRQDGTAETMRRVDFGHAHLPSPTPAELEGMLAPQREAPILLPAHLDAWAQTSPRPTVDPDVSLWLHGVPDEVEDVQIVWRADLPADRPRLWADILALCPPASAEAMPVPVYVVRAWLANRRPPDTADIPGEAYAADSAGSLPVPVGRRVLRWRGEDDLETDLIGSDDVRPGDTLVVPSWWGGADEFGWQPNPATAKPVPDLGDRAQLEQRGRATLRISPPLSEDWLPHTSPLRPRLRRATRKAFKEAEEDGTLPDVEAILDILKDASDAAAWLRETARRLRVDPRRHIDVHPSDGIVIRSSRRMPYHPSTPDLQTDEDGSAEPDFTSQDDASSFVSRPVPLLQHSEGVAELATQFAGACVPAKVAADLGLAGRLHDLGKTDPRFQRWLHGGDEVAALLSEPLAKSGMRSRWERERARALAGYPTHARHELLSTAMIESALKDLGAIDGELVLHLVASHHGFCRPFAPVWDESDDLHVEDHTVAERAVHATTLAASGLARLDSGVADRFWSLLRKYGWLGLPYLEAILRLADHRRSELDEFENQA